MHKAKLFQNGRSQAVRLPKDCQLPGSEVYIKKLEGVVMLVPKRHPWASLVRSLYDFSDDFMVTRGQPRKQRRPAFE